jgi:hypothetical protein
MAINYLNTVNLNKNQLENAAIQNLTSDPLTGVKGQIYYNLTSSALKICVTANVVGPPAVNAVWQEVGAASVVAGTGIVVTAGTGSNAGNSVITNSGLIDLNIYAGTQTWPITTSVNTTLSFVSASADEIVVNSPSAGTVRIGLPDDVTIGNNLTITNDLTVSNDGTVEGDLSVQGDFTGAAAGSFDSLGVTGATSIGGLLTAANGLAVTGATLSANANTAIDLGANRVTNIADPTAAQDAATKAYVDAATVGGLIYQGAYNPVTNTPDIDRGVVVLTTSISGMGSGGGPFTGIADTVATTGTGQGLTLNIELNQAGNVTSATVANGGTGYAVGDTVGLTGLSGHSGSVIAIATIAAAGSPGANIGIETGWTYTVVADGTFYGEAVGIGDVLISETDNPTSLVNWTTVQNNIDLASALQVGIGNVAPGEAIDVTYSGGTATVSVEDSTALNKGAVIVAGTDPITVTYASGTATVGIEDSATDNKGAVSLEGSNGIAISYTSGHAIISRDATIFNAVRRSLDTTVTGNPGTVTRTVASGITTFTVNTNSMGLGAASALDVKAEVMSAAGQTVYADITRSGNVLSIIFTGTVNDGDYEVLMSATVNRG